MSRRDNGEARCARCRMHRALCVCPELPELELSTRLELVIHRDEAKKTSNTGLLAVECLVNSGVTRVGAGRKAPTQPAIGGRRALLLFPGDGVPTLSEQHRADEGVVLFVPDGNWRQAAKMCRRIPWLATVERVTLPIGAPTGYHLRSKNKAHGLATMEAIARALGLLEGEAAQHALERVFRLMVDRTLFSRGLLDRADVFGGLADGVKRHEPAGSDVGLTHLVAK